MRQAKRRGINAAAWMSQQSFAGRIAPMSEAEFIAQEQANRDKQLLRQLRRVADHQILGRYLTETLSVNGLIEFGGPSLTCSYNHWRLTAEGLKTARKLATK